MCTGLSDALKVLKSGNPGEKIRMLESLADTADHAVLREIISRLDDPDIRVRGGAFSSLVLNKNDILDVLLGGLESRSRTVRAHAALVLANRAESTAFLEIDDLTHDESPMVRACALGALGYLGSERAYIIPVGYVPELPLRLGCGTPFIMTISEAIRRGLHDPSSEVAKCALQAAVDAGDSLTADDLHDVLLHKDAEVEWLLTRIKRED